MIKAMVLAPHQDDEVLGCGATIAGLKDVRVVSLGMKTVNHRLTESVVEHYRSNLREALNDLGVVHPPSFYDFETECFDRDSRRLMMAIENEVYKYRPEVVFVPWIDDVHQDHRATAQAARVATRGLNGITSSVMWYSVPGASEQFVPNVYIPVELDQVERKRTAWMRFPEEHREEPHPRSWPVIEAQMRVNGAAVGVAMAEVFQLVRWVWR